MRLLLDTCALLWLTDDRERLSDAALEALSREDATLFVSAISAFEIAIKVRKGKLALPHPPREWFTAATRAHRLTEVPVSAAIALYACDVPLQHGDPADRMIVATALIEQMPVITSDGLMAACPGLTVIW